MKRMYTINLDYIPAVLDCCEYEDGYMVHRINVPVKNRGQGHGRELMRQLVADADTEGAKLYLGIVPSGPLDYDALKSWYERNGFIFVENGEGMYVREPMVKHGN